MNFKTMSYSNTVNCYCFNPQCNSSIFKAKYFAAIPESVSKVLSHTLFCKSCNSEMIAKPTLEVKSQLNRLLSKREKLKAIFIDDDPVFHKMMEYSLKRKDTSIDKSKFSLNAADVITYLKENINEQEQLPDLIFVDINMPMMDGWEFLAELEKLYTDFPKQPHVYMTSSNIMPGHKARTKQYRFVKGLIAKPFNNETIKKLPRFELCE